MPDSHDRTEKSDDANAQERAREALERGVAEIKTPEQARHALDSLEKIAGDLREEDVARAGSDAAPEQQAAAIEEAEDVAAAAKPASVIATAALQSANAAPGGKSIIDESVSQALGGGGESDAPPTDMRRGRRHLRQELFQRLHPLQAVDAFVFVQINQIPHTQLLDRFMTRLSWVMTGGNGWLLFLLLATLVDRQRGWKATRVVVPALWLATATVEHPIKKWFRRRRPFVSLIEAIIVGRKPGSYSFPSGHSAAAFAGALLLTREYPGSARGFFGLASLVAFSRIYLGAHYPGDVLSGSLLGMVLARIYSCVLRKIGVAPEYATRAPYCLPAKQSGRLLLFGRTSRFRQGEQFGGANRELAPAMQYSILGANCEDIVCKDLFFLMDIGTEELSNLEKSAHWRGCS